MTDKEIKHYITRVEANDSEINISVNHKSGQFHWFSMDVDMMGDVNKLTREEANAKTAALAKFIKEAIEYKLRMI